MTTPTVTYSPESLYIDLGNSTGKRETKVLKEDEHILVVADYNELDEIAGIEVIFFTS